MKSKLKELKRKKKNKKKTDIKIRTKDRQTLAKQNSCILNRKRETDMFNWAW